MAVDDHLRHASNAAFVALLRRASKRPTPGWTRQLAAALASNEPRTLVNEIVGAATAGTAAAAEWDPLVTTNGDLTRGAVHAYAALHGPDALAALKLVAARSGRLRGGSGIAPNAKVAGAAIVAIGSLATPEAAAALTELDGVIRHRGLRLDIAAALATIAAAHDVAVDELVDRSAPADIDTPAARDAARRAARERLDHQLADERQWSPSDWRAVFIDHPVTGEIGPGLVWVVEHSGGATTCRWDPAAQAFVDLTTTKLATPAGARIRLWHPAASPEQIDAWRQHLESHGVQQPFKQAARETYAVEPRDHVDARYTNRFAGRVLRYRQVLVIGKQRGWVAGTGGHWSPEAGGCAHRDFIHGEWRATFYVDVVGRGGPHETAEFSRSDQVHFTRYDREQNGWFVVRLGGVPPAVSSEALRDIALFVETAAIDEDKEWTDRGAPRADPNWPSSSWWRGSFLALNDRDGHTVRRRAPDRVPTPPL